ncbi:MAG: biopolymer transporter ExbD, partial [bacterium]
MKKKKKGALGEITMASTSDVAFLLLIFFIVTTIFAAEQGLTLVLPGKQKEEDDTVRVAEKNIATLFVQADNSITLDKRPIMVNGIKNAIEDRLLGNPKLVVVLKVHPEADYGRMVACLD